MKVTLIGQSFDKCSGQGIYKFSNYLYHHLRAINKDIKTIEVGNSKNPFMTLFNNIFVSSYKMFMNKSEIYHFMMPEISFSCLFKKPSVVTVHDLIPLIINERKKSFNLYFKFMMKIIAHADHLIAVSNSTKKDLIRILHIPPKKISVIYEGVDHKKFYPLKKMIKKKFIIGYLGGLGKRKNVEYILQVAQEFKNNKNILFRIAGKGPELDKLIKLKENLNLKNVEFLGFVSDDELNNFYNSLNLFIFPSKYEGFGLPVVEAMACGIPLMVSDGSSLTEISKYVGILIDFEKPIDAVKKIKKFVTNKKLQKKLEIKSKKNAKKFNWDKTAIETFKIYEGLLKK